MDPNTLKVLILVASGFAIAAGGALAVLDIVTKTAAGIWRGAFRLLTVAWFYIITKYVVVPAAGIPGSPLAYVYLGVTAGVAVTAVGVIFTHIGPDRSPYPETAMPSSRVKKVLLNTVLAALAAGAGVLYGTDGAWDKAVFFAALYAAGRAAAGILAHVADTPSESGIQK